MPPVAEKSSGRPQPVVEENGTVESKAVMAVAYATTPAPPGHPPPDARYSASIRR